MGARLDDSGFRGSPQVAEAIKNIRNGDTYYQHKRELIKRAIGGGIQGALTAGRAVAGWKAEEDTEQERRNKTIQDALKTAQRPPTAPPQQAAGYTDEYGLPVTSEFAPKMGDASVHAGQGVNPEHEGYSPESIKALATQLTATGKTNDAAQAAPINGVWNKEGFGQADMQAAVNGSDINRAKDLMGFGGLLSSSYNLDGPSGADDLTKKAGY